MKTNYTTDTIALKKIMIDKNIETILELSQITGINRNRLSKVLNGDLQPTADMMKKLVAALEIEPERAGKIFFKPNLRIA